MGSEKHVSPKSNRFKACLFSIVGLAIVIIIVIFFIVHHHHSQTNATNSHSQQTMTVDDLRIAYVSPPRPATVALQPLFPDKQQDRQTLQNLLQWIQKAQVLHVDQIMSIPMYSETLTLTGKDGKNIEVQYGSACQKTSSNGNTGVECQEVKDVVTITRDGDKKQTFYQSKELYDFLQHAPQTLPHVPYMVYPKSVKAGSTFQVEGNAWVTSKVTVHLLQGRVALASKSVVPVDGHFKIDFTCPPIKPGAYFIEYVGAPGPGMSSVINVTP